MVSIIFFFIIGVVYMLYFLWKVEFFDFVCACVEVWFIIDVVGLYCMEFILL